MTAREIVYCARDISVGDHIAYPGRLHGRAERGDRDWLRVTRTTSEDVWGIRLHPKDWERDQEFIVVALQIANHGVEINNRVPEHVGV